MAVINPIRSRLSIDTGSIPNTQIDDGVGQGLRAVGAAVSRYEEMRRQVQRFSTAQSFDRWQQDNTLKFADHQTNIDPSGIDFAKTVTDEFSARREQFLKTVPSWLRGEYEQITATAVNGWSDKGVAAEKDQRSTWYTTGIDDRRKELEVQVFNDPKQFEAAKSDAYRKIDASGLSPKEKEAERRKTDETLKLAVGKHDIELAEKDPQYASDAAGRLGVTGASPVEQVVSRIIGAESGGDPNAKNPKSSASGVGQFTNGTWLATIKKHRPEIAAGKSDRELLALKGNLALGREMTTRLTEESAHDLAAAGLPVTPGSLYLAHFAGIGGAKAVLRSDPGRSLSDVLDPAAMKANGFLNGKTAGWLVSWADGKMKGGSTPQVPTDPRYDGLSLDQRLEIYNRMQAAAQRGQTAIDAQNKADYTSMKGAMELGIRTGDIASRQQIMGSSLTDADKASMLDSLKSHQGDAMATGEAVSLFSAGNLRVDPYDAKGRKTVDNAWTAVSQAVPTEQLQATAEEMVRQTGVVPQSVVNNIRQGLTSKDINAVMQAAQMAQRISTVDPAALGRRDGGSEAQKAADLYSSYTDMGLTAEDAARRIAEARDPEKVKARAALMDSKPIKDFVKNTATESNVRDIFDPGLFGFDPQLGETPAQTAAMVGEYSTILEESIFDANGDTEAGKSLADQRFARIYSPSKFTFSGEGTVVRYPPEVTYPADGNGSRDYVRSQAVEALKDEGIDATEIYLQPDAQTELDVQAGRPAHYQLFYQEKGSDLKERFMLPFYAVPPTKEQSTDQMLAPFESRMIENRDKLVRGRDREGSLDAFLDGNPLTGQIATPKPTPLPNPVTPASQVQDQRSQLFKNAQDDGTLSPRGILSGSDDVFGSR